MQEISQDGERMGQRGGGSHGQLETLHAQLMNQEGDSEQGASASCGFSPVLKP